MTYWEMAVDAPILTNLTYKSQDIEVNAGELFLVPLGKRTVKAIAIKPVEKPKNLKFEIKNISEKINTFPKLDNSRVQWLQWMSQYYVYSPGPTFLNSFPPLDKKKGKPRKAPQKPSLNLSPKNIVLNSHQKQAYENVISKSGFHPYLLHGITGSGKTEVYIEVIKELTKNGGQALVLVPEISLTPQLISRFSKAFSKDVALYHSHLTPREKTNYWWDMVDQKKFLMIGARSALFCPIPDLKIIIMDEEHESSFKQDEKLRYHARDSAIYLAKLLNIPIVLGSATPSLESWQNHINQKIEKLSLPVRAQEASLPKIEVVDMKLEKENRKDDPSFTNLPFWLSKSLYKKIIERLEKKEQIALFLNRRGQAHCYLCTACGYTKDCPNCSVNLTLHANNHLVCHYCEYNETLTSKCSSCGLEEMKTLGIGTEQVESDLSQLFPNVKISRADRDEIQNRESLENLIKEFESNETQILVGTQMIAKGLDFPNLTLVGVLLADIAFNLPDFRAGEKSYQLLHQVSGRAGRHQSPGEVVIQCYNLEHPSIVMTQNHNYSDWADHELQSRKALRYPPFGRLLNIKAQGNSAKKTEDLMFSVVQIANRLVSEHKTYEGTQILGPSPSPLFKVRGKYRFQALIKAPKTVPLSKFAHHLWTSLSSKSLHNKITFDVDPYNML